MSYLYLKPAVATKVIASGRPVARLGGTKYILGGNIFVFIICLKQIFLDTKYLGVLPPNVPTWLRAWLVGGLWCRSQHLQLVPTRARNLFLVDELSSFFADCGLHFCCLPAHQPLLGLYCDTVVYFLVASA